MLKIAGVLFEENLETRDTAFFFDEEDGEFSIALNIDYLDNNFEGENCSPSLDISFFEIENSEISQLIGKSFSVADIETAQEREDTFYLFEHEPLEEYTVTILEIKDKKIHIACKGTAVTDGYADPYQTAPFELDCWLPIITCSKDWESFGL